MGIKKDDPRELQKSSFRVRWVVFILCPLFGVQIKDSGFSKKDWFELPNPKPKHFFFATRSVENRCKISPFSLARRRGDRTAGA